MLTYPDIRMRALATQRKEASDKLDAQDYDEAIPLLRALDGRLRQLGLASAWVKWGLAVALDVTGDPLAALDAVKQGLAEDPLEPMIHSSYGIICGRLRAQLLEAEPGDAAVARLYRTLQEEAESDVSSHLAWAAHLAHEGRTAEAETVLAAVTCLAPASRDAWDARAALARTLGKLEEAATHEAEARLRGADEVALGIPTPGGDA